MLHKMTICLLAAATLTAALTANGLAFSGGAPHVVTHPIVMSQHDAINTYARHHRWTNRGH